MDADQKLVDSYMDRAVEEFDANPLSTQLIRKFADQMPDMFVPAAIRHLATTRQSNAHRFLSILMLRQQSALMEHLTNPKETRHLAINLFRRVAQIDPAFDVKLARRLPDRVGTNHHEALSGARAGRTLEILGETSRGRRLIPILGHLVESCDALLRDKATLFIGRRVQSTAWAERQLAKSDDRVRANAIESIWGLDLPAAKTLLENCASDKSNRVAGNALIGLHVAGHHGIGNEVMSMSVEHRALFRSTAAWTMGKIGDTAFYPRLTELVRDDQPVVRSAALRSLIDLRRAEASTLEAIAAKGAQQVGSAPAVAEALVAEAAQLAEAFEGIAIRLDGATFASRRC